MRYSSPRHLPDPPPHERAALTGQPLLIAVTIVIGGLLATALTRHGDSAETDTAAPPETTGAPPQPAAAHGERSRREAGAGRAHSQLARVR